jgi:hypothetical protein
MKVEHEIKMKMIVIKSPTLKKNILITIAVFFLVTHFAKAQCSTSNGGACICADGTTNCLLLPDIIVSKTALTETGGYEENSQTGNGAKNGQLLVTGATPNIGYGPLHVLATDTFYCGTDSFLTSTPPVLCPDGTPIRQLLKQRIYQKNGSTISYIHKRSGIMTFHTGHNHFHIDDWLQVTLRIRDSLVADPRKWEIVGESDKISFCLADIKQCTQANGYCRDSSGQILDNTNIPNFGIMENYNSCGKEQGISPGYMDVYDKSTPGMNINIPYGTCNGEYWLVAEVDPMNVIMESNDSNNLVAFPITLTKQLTWPYANISSIKGSILCKSNDTIQLEANAGLSYLWSTGASTRKISVDKAGKYSVQVKTYCGTAVSDTFVVKQAVPVMDSIKGATICKPGTVSLKAFSKDSVYWYNDKDSVIFKGNVFTTPVIDTTTIYYAVPVSTAKVDTFHGGKQSITATGNYYAGTDWMRFNCYTPFVIKSVKVYADSARFRTFRLWDTQNAELQSNNFFVPAGMSRVQLNFHVQPGFNYKLLCQTPYMFRESVPTFPYSIPNVIDMVGSGLDTYYPYLYDWEIVLDAGPCAKQIGAKQQVNAIVGNQSPLSISGLDTAYFNTDPAVNISGFPSGGTFSGPGISGNLFDPSTANIGNNAIKYTYADNVGCVDSITKLVKVKLFVSTKLSPDHIARPTINPNPSQGVFEFTFANGTSAEIKIYDALGKLIISNEKAASETKINIDLSPYPGGMYMAHISNNSSYVSLKLILIK